MRRSTHEQLGVWLLKISARLVEFNLFTNESSLFQVYSLHLNTCYKFWIFKGHYCFKHLNLNHLNELINTRVQVCEQINKCL